MDETRLLSCPPADLESAWRALGRHHRRHFAAALTREHVASEFLVMWLEQFGWDIDTDEMERYRRRAGMGSGQGAQ
ncbi:hypothetical protein [Salininema proteolyticum]|uniref:Uncharacterized protein n=1 Tax=Salininema proteolyticum TaxID=1607685 RepID=A0ABV8TYW6_9ACTN